MQNSAFVIIKLHFLGLGKILKLIMIFLKFVPVFLGVINSPRLLSSEYLMGILSIPSFESCIKMLSTGHRTESRDILLYTFYVDIEPLRIMH